MKKYSGYAIWFLFSGMLALIFVHAYVGLALWAIGLVLGLGWTLFEKTPDRIKDDGWVDPGDFGW